MDINVRLGGGGGGSNGRQSKLSAKHTSYQAKQTVQQAQSSNVPQMLKKAGRVASGVVQGNAGKIASTIPYVASIYVGIKALERIANFGTTVYQSWSGEDMIASNLKASIKTITSLGLNLFSGSIKNEIFIKPRLMRENYMRDYNRELYGNIGYNDKNKLT